MVGEGVGRGTLYLYELVGKCVYLYVGRVIDGRTKVARAIDGRTKDVVPIFSSWRIHFFLVLNLAALSIFPSVRSITRRIDVDTAGTGLGRVFEVE